jgi:hypothetical protein
VLAEAAVQIPRPSSFMISRLVKLCTSALYQTAPAL